MPDTLTIRLPGGAAVVHSMRTVPGVYGANLALHVGDAAAAVHGRRAALQARLGLARVAYLNQVHGVAVVEASSTAADEVTADAVWTRQTGVGCAVLTADCLPVVLTDRRGGCAGVAHCGWRGLAAGVLSALVAQLPAAPEALVAYLGPGIGAARYVVGADVVDAFARLGPDAASCFRPAAHGARHCADLEALARLELRSLGVREIRGGGYCTARDPRFFSYRRDGLTGRFATVVWLDGGEFSSSGRSW